MLPNLPWVGHGTAERRRAAGWQKLAGCSSRCVKYKPGLAWHRLWPPLHCHHSGSSRVLVSVFFWAPAASSALKQLLALANLSFQEILRKIQLQRLFLWDPRAARPQVVSGSCFATGECPSGVEGCACSTCPEHPTPGKCLDSNGQGGRARSLAFEHRSPGSPSLGDQCEAGTGLEGSESHQGQGGMSHRARLRGSGGTLCPSHFALLHCLNITFWKGGCRFSATRK